jgi:long-chain acyl-CoA synthetase
VLAAISRHARERPREIVYRTPARAWTFAELEEAANRAAQGLVGLGIGRGERVACLTEHTAECVALVLRACKIGAVCMPVNWRLAPPEIEYIVNHGAARLMLADAAFEPALREPYWRGRERHIN